MSNEEPKPIVAPVADKKRESVRAVEEATAELVPGGSFVTNILQVALPPESEKDREKWQKAISERTNKNTDRLDEHERLLNPTMTLMGTAAQLAVGLAKACPDGLGHEQFDLDALCKLLPEVDRQEIEDATADLEGLGLVQRERSIGKYWSIRLTPAFYAQLDRPIMGWDSTADAVVVARLLLEKDASGAASDLHKQTSWGKRRFNPAFRIVLGMFPEGRISQEIQPDYPSRYVRVLPEDRAVLRRFVIEAEGA
jgi:hypothetical protein